MYAEPGLDSYRLINISDCIEMGESLKYIRKISDIRYIFNTGIITKPKDEDKSQVKG